MARQPPRSISVRHLKVLLIDCDPQGNATSGLGIEKDGLELSIYDALINDTPMEEIIIQTQFGLDVVPSVMDLAGAEVELVNLEDKQYRLKKAVELVKEKYDYILIDCPPSLGHVTLNALTAADSVLLPLQCEFYALEGLSQLLSTVQLVKKMFTLVFQIRVFIRKGRDFPAELFAKLFEIFNLDKKFQNVAFTA